MHIDCLRKLRLLFEDFPKSNNLLLVAQPPLIHKLRQGINEDLRSRITYSVHLKPLAPDDIRSFILEQLDRYGLPHGTPLPMTRSPSSYAHPKAYCAAYATSVSEPCSRPSGSGNGKSASTRSTASSCNRIGDGNMTLRSKWTPEQIRQARQIPLHPLLEQMGYAMQQKPRGNWSINTLPGDIVIKENYWVSLSSGSGGNTIDLLTQLIPMTQKGASQ